MQHICEQLHCAVEKATQQCCIINMNYKVEEIWCCITRSSPFMLRLVFVICNQKSSRSFVNQDESFFIPNNVKCYSVSLKRRLVKLSCMAFIRLDEGRLHPCSGSFPLNFSSFSSPWMSSNSVGTLRIPETWLERKSCVSSSFVGDDFQRDASTAVRMSLASHIIIKPTFCNFPFWDFPRLKLILSRVIEKLRNFPS